MVGGYNLLRFHQAQDDRIDTASPLCENQSELLCDDPNR
jgi:hypothetical protein